MQVEDPDTPSEHTSGIKTVVAATAGALACIRFPDATDGSV